MPCACTLRDIAKILCTAQLVSAREIRVRRQGLFLTAIVVALVRGAIAEKGAGMGDKGGKKDKEKNKQQQLTKHKQEEQKKHGKAPAKKPAAGTA